MTTGLPSTAEIAKPRLAQANRVATVIAALFSMLTFPSVLPWMVACWLIVHTRLSMRNRPAWVPLAICLAILILKMVPRTPFMLLFGFILAVVIFSRIQQDRLPRLAANRWIGLLVIWIAWVFLLLHWWQIETCSHPNVLDPSRPIVCIGDSLTDGLLPDHGYPEQLKSMVTMPVVNLGFSGISTSQGLGQIERVLSHHPQVVVIELGGHDFLKGHGRKTISANLIKMIDQSRDAGADVILMEIPRGFMFDPYWSVEREIAYKKDVQLVSDTWLRQIVFLSPIAPPGKWFPSLQLSDDGIHSNRRGSEAIARRVAKAIKAMYGKNSLLSREALTYRENLKRRP